MFEAFGKVLVGLLCGAEAQHAFFGTSEVQSAIHRLHLNTGEIVDGLVLWHAVL